MKNTGNRNPILARLLNRQVLRWGILGGVFAGVGLILIKLFAGILAWPYAVATLVSGEACTLVRFLAVDRWVFHHRRPTWTRLWQYHVANVVGFAIWWSAANVLKTVGVQYLLASIFAMFFSVGFNLASNFLWIWRKQEVHS